jgi:hypothetical protein
VLSSTLSNASAAAVLQWEHAAALADRILPGWAVRIHYDSEARAGLCRLRTRRNVELVDMSRSTLPAGRWPYASVLDGSAAAALFFSPGPAAAAPGACVLERAAAWYACGGAKLPPHWEGLGCRSPGRAKAADCAKAGGCLWGVREEGLAAVRSLVLQAGATAEEGLRGGLVTLSPEAAGE